MAYLFLAMAIGAEIIGTTLLKYSDGFTKFIPTIFSLLAYLVCHVSFSRAVKDINLGIAYAVWCGVGIIVTAIISRFVFGEAVSAAELAGIGLILAGCMVMNLL